MHNDVMEIAKDKILYDMRPDELDELFQTIVFNAKEKGGAALQCHSPGEAGWVLSGTKLQNWGLEPW